MSSQQPTNQQTPKTNPLDYKLALKSYVDNPISPLKQLNQPLNINQALPPKLPANPNPNPTGDKKDTLQAQPNPNPTQAQKPLARNMSTPNMFSPSLQIGPSPMDRVQGIRRGEGISQISDRLNQAPKRAPSQAPAPSIVSMVAPIIQKPQPAPVVQAAPVIETRRVVDDSVNKQARNMLAEAMAKVALLVMENNRLKYKESNLVKDLKAIKNQGGSTIHQTTSGLGRSSSYQVLPGQQPTYTVTPSQTRAYSPASTLTQSIHLSPHEVRTHQAPVTTSYLRPSQTYVTNHLPHQQSYLAPQPAPQTIRTVYQDATPQPTIRRSGLGYSSYSNLPLESHRVVSQAGPIRVSQTTLQQSPVKTTTAYVSRNENYMRELY